MLCSLLNIFCGLFFFLGRIPCCGFLKDMAKKRRKVRDGTKEEGQGPKIVAADLISKLPDHVIHHILSFLPTIYAVRMSLLSRCWRRMWYSIPALKFDDHQIKEELFFNFVEQCLKHRQMGMQGNTTSVIARFELRISHCRVDSFQVDRWLSYAARPHLKELIVNAVGIYCMSGFCRLPQFALDLTSLTILNLKFMKLEDISHVNLPSLISMSLSYVDVEAKVLHNLILGCPSLERCFIEEDEDDFSSNLQISSSSLKFLHIEGCWEIIQIEAINLESFVYVGCGDPSSNFDLTSCKQLTRLSMTDAYFNCDRDFEGFISGFPLLESLTFKGYHLVDIRHQYLKVLVLEEHEDWDGEVKSEISIDAPNLVSFSYNSYELLQIVLNSPNLLETNITLHGFEETFSMDWYVNMLNFLSCFDCSKSMSFNLPSEQALTFPENLQKLVQSSPLPNLKHLKVNTRCKLERESNFEKALCWLSPSLEKLSIVEKLEKKA